MGTNEGKSLSRFAIPLLPKPEESAPLGGCG